MTKDGESRIRGLIAIIMVLAISPFILSLFNLFRDYKLPSYIDQSHESQVVEIVGVDVDGGIYFVERGMTANQLLSSLGSGYRAKNDFLLQSGIRLTIDSDFPENVARKEIDNVSRLAMGMPIDLNAASVEELILIPGVGIKTADKILKSRKEKKKFKNIDELMEIDGIKEKKLEKLRRYLYVRENQ